MNCFKSQVCISCDDCEGELIETDENEAPGFGSLDVAKKETNGNATKREQGKTTVLSSDIALEICICSRVTQQYAVIALMS